MAKDGKGTVLSLNEQKVTIDGGKFNYWGGRVPLDHELEEKCKEISLQVAESLNMDGFFGVDLVLDDNSAYFMEINPRLTTSFIGLSNIMERNLANLLLEKFENKEKKVNMDFQKYSAIRIPRAKEGIEIEDDQFKGLEKIPEIISPP
ncbi:MAG: ATP-grasp domain-containing protein, partial [Candidatus Aenigmatarchaeota archaeon]